LTVDGTGVALRVSGALQGGRLDYHASLEMKDLSRLTKALTGHANLSARITGPVAKAAVEASGAAELASKGFARQHLDIAVQAVGLPESASATFRANGRFDDAKLALNAVLAGQGATRTARISADWKSLVLRASLVLPAKGAPTGGGTLDVKSLNDLSPLTGMPAKGNLHLAAQMIARDGKSRLALQGRAADLTMAGSTLRTLTLDGTVIDPFAHSALALTFDAYGLAAEGWSGDGRGSVRGALDGITLILDAKLVDPRGSPAHVAGQAVLDANHQTLNLQQLKADWQGKTVSLAAPALVNFSSGVSIDNLRLAAGGGTITLSGKVTPRLALKAGAENVRAESISLFLPQISANGTLSGTADLRGTLASPQGTITLRARGLRDRVYAATAAASVDIDARAVLHGAMATFNATLAAEKNGRLTLTGEAPLTADGALDLRLAGHADLALLDSLLAAGGRRMRGVIQMDTVIAGKLAAPRVRGSASLTDGEFQDFARGIRLRNVKTTLKAQKDGIHLVTLSAAAGSGTITANGIVDAWSPGIPLELNIRANNARPIASDLLTASLSGSARLAGELQGDMTLKGAVTVQRAEVMLPQSFPPEVRTLKVRHRGRPPPRTPRRGGAMMLDLTVHTAGPVTLRGRGIDADLGGDLRIGGSAQTPDIGGGFRMRRGTFSIAGQTLTFATGKITFDGTGVRGRLDPALDFVASQTSGGVTATLTVGGYASLPKIALSSTPQLPQDEVLARLLFQQSAKQLSPLQLAEAAQALASIAGIGSGFSPLASLRGGLGLDRLSVGSGSGPTTGTTVEAGKYVSHNVYVGARQGMSGGTQAQVQLDLTGNLKVQATVSTGASATATKGATAADDNGSSIGLSYQFDY
jgi:translocation and assembly module TamB